MAYAVENNKLKSATDLVVSGGSAGAMGTFIHCDNYVEKVQKWSQNIKSYCLPDSGFFLDYTQEFEDDLRYVS